MAEDEVGTIEEQIRKICPSGAIGYRIQVYEPTPEIYPLKRSGSDMYAIDPEGIEYPVGVPPGDHQVIFLDKNSRAIKAYKNPVINIEKPRTKRPSATAAPKGEDPKDAKEAEDAASADLDAEINAAAAGFNFDFSGDYQKQVQDHDMYRKRIRLAKEARYTGEVAELTANVTASHDEILRKIIQINKTQHFHEMAQISLVEGLAKAYSKVPKPEAPPAPPLDWGSLIKTTLDGVLGIVQTFGGKRQEVDRAAFAREVAEAVKAVAKGEHVGALPADRVAEKADHDKRGNDDKRDNDKRDNDKRDNDKRDNDDKRDNGKRDNDKRDNGKRAADSSEKPEADKRATADQSHRTEETEKKKESVNSYSSAWKFIRAAWVGLTDQAIVQMVAQPVLLVAFLATLGSMAPQRPRLDRQATIYLPAVRR